MPEGEPRRPLRVEVISVEGEHGLLIFDQQSRRLEQEGGPSVELHDYESEILGLLISSPDTPFKLYEIREELPSLNDKYAPTPGEVIKEIVQSAPFLRGHLIAIIKSTTQFFGFTDIAGKSDEFERNLHKRLEADASFDKSGDAAKRHARVKNIVRIALAGTAASAFVGFVHHRHTNKDS